MLKAKDLIQYGYFPSEIPPPFNTSSLGDNLDNLSLSVLERWNKVPKTNITESKCCLYSVPRVKNFRRILHIPNPFYQIILCDYIESVLTLFVISPAGGTRRARESSEVVSRRRKGTRAQRSNPMEFRYIFIAAWMVLPVPAKGSSTVSPTNENIPISRRAISAGKGAGWAR